TTPDLKFTLETVNCLGACALGPVVVIDGEYYPTTPARMEKLLWKYDEQKEEKNNEST
ncbi:MAG: NAD(P)H-dependent oxidoreductase subunit E, partial [Thermoplasmata archaeon]